MTLLGWQTAVGIVPVSGLSFSVNMVVTIVGAAIGVGYLKRRIDEAAKDALAANVAASTALAQVNEVKVSIARIEGALAGTRPKKG